MTRIAAVVAFVLVLAGHLVRRGSLAERPPSYGPIDLLVLALSVAAGVLAAIALLRGKSPPPAQGIAVSYAVIAVAWAHAVVMAVNPELFRWLIREDGISEWASALLLLAGALALAIGVVSMALRGGFARREMLVIAVMALALFVIGMEEASWFQRQLGLVTPDWLHGQNSQRELNFHNVNTLMSENFYYVLPALFVLIARGRWGSAEAPRGRSALPMRPRSRWW